MAGTTDILAFKDWCRINDAPIKDKQKLYKEYLEGFITESIQDSSKNPNTTNEIKEYYKGFLSRLIVYYVDDPDVRLLSDIDMDDDKQLISAIPLFSKKIKELTDEFKNNKKRLRNKKELYSSKGSKVGLQKSLSEAKREHVNIKCLEKYNITC